MSRGQDGAHHHRSALSLEIRAIIFGTEGDTHHAGRSGSDGVSVHHSERALDSSHDLCASHATELTLHFLYLAFNLNHLLGGLGLRHTDNMDAGLYDSLDVFLAIRSVERIYSDHHLRIAVIDALQCIIDKETCSIFFSHCDGVLKVEHN